jgi:glycosyltransferase involved in cell wall biosynthesis
VTIVITAYNYARFLPRSLESALAQRYEPLEVLVMDNASTDETPEVLARYAADPRLRVIRNERNVGMARNHNLGLTNARGEYILFLSADDALVEDAVDRVMRYYDAHPDVDVVYGWAYSMDEAGRTNGYCTWSGLPLAAYHGER